VGHVSQNVHNGDDDGALYLNYVDGGDDDGGLHLRHVKNHVDFRCLFR